MRTSVNRTLRSIALSLLFLAWPGLLVAQTQPAATPKAPATATRVSAAARPSIVALTILHTNDTHSHLLPFSYPAVGPIEAGADTVALKERNNIGGIARRATLVQQVRNQVAAGRGTVWLVDAGDFSDGTPLSIVYHGEADVAAMNAAGYKFGTLGNHEFNIPLAQTRKLVGMARFPLLCANVTDTATGRPFVQESTVEPVGALRIAVFGLITRAAATYQAAKEGVTIADEIQTARRMAAALRKQADIVVLISHAGQEVDRRIADEVPGIDVIIGGHSHSRLPIGDLIWHSDDLRVDDVNGTVLVQAHQWGGELGRLDLLFEKNADGWHVARYRERLIPVTADIAPDPKVAAVVDQYWQPISAQYGEVIGQADGDFTVVGDDQAHYNLFTDAVRETFGADVELENTSSIRSALVKGPITRGDMVMMDPFNNTVVTLKMPGRDLKRVLELHRPFVSGLRYRVENKQLVEATIGGRPVEDERIYAVVTNSYFANYAFKDLRADDVRDTRRSRLDVVIDYVRKKGTVKPVYDGRRVVGRSSS